MYMLSLCQEANFVKFPLLWISLEGAAPARRKLPLPKADFVEVASVNEYPGKAGLGMAINFV